MELDKIIERLNKNETISNIVVNNLEESNLTDDEKQFIKRFIPEKSLIIYGTLAPGKPNHHIVENIKGEWIKAIVRGKLENKGWGADLGYKAFRHTNIEEQVKIDAYILLSEELVANWHYLDEFEGNGYKRILAKYELENGEIGVGYIYATNDNIV